MANITTNISKKSVSEMKKPSYIFIEVMDRTISCPEFFETLEEAKKHLLKVLFELSGWDWDACSSLSSKELYDYCYENFETDGEWGITSDICSAWVDDTCSGEWDCEIFEGGQMENITAS